MERTDKAARSTSPRHLDALSERRDDMSANLESLH